MDLSLAIRKGYYNALALNVVFNTKIVEVYDSFAPSEVASYPYIIISTINTNQVDVKRCRIYDVSVLIDVVTGSTEANFGREESDLIGEQISAIINPETYIDVDLSANGFSIGNTTESSRYLTARNTPYFIFRKLLTFEHIINKL